VAFVLVLLLVLEFLRFMGPEDEDDDEDDSRCCPQPAGLAAAENLKVPWR
jgi:hypothetical protein